ncbi:MAG: hypothetical protein COB22_02340 [Cycloclasticus sp.]|nr:MAG: hypothetical protein COB22_02340 [Cycloclasticus sp.]
MFLKQRNFVYYFWLLLFILPAFFPQYLLENFELRSLALAIFFVPVGVFVLTSFFTGWAVWRSHRVILLMISSALAIIFILDFFDGEIYLKGYKVLILLLIPFVVCKYSERFDSDTVCKLIWYLFLTYIVLTFSSYLAGHSREVIVGTLYKRLDITGSLTAHAVLCSLFIMFTLAWFNTAKYIAPRWFMLCMLFVALYMLFKTGNRQSLLVLFIFGFVYTLAFPKKLQSILYASYGLMGMAGVFFMYTIFIDSNLFYRLFLLDERGFSSGRQEAIIYWISQVENVFTGLGLGNTAEFLVNLRGELYTYENFPHNELIRFYVEGGIFGLLFILLLLGYFFYWSYVVIKFDKNRMRVLYVTAVFSTVFISSVLDNLIFDMYKSNAYLMIILMMWSFYKRDTEEAKRGRQSD